MSNDEVLNEVMEVYNSDPNMNVYSAVQLALQLVDEGSENLEPSGMIEVGLDMNFPELPDNEFFYTGEVACRYILIGQKFGPGRFHSVIEQEKQGGPFSLICDQYEDITDNFDSLQVTHIPLDCLSTFIKLYCKL